MALKRDNEAKPKSSTSGKKVEIKYPEDLIMAVKYLARKGLNSREIADRLEISPYTVKSIKRILRKRSLLEAPEARKAKAKAESKKSEPKSNIDVLRERRTAMEKDKLKKS